MKRAIVAIAVVAAALGGDAYGKTIYVDADAVGANNGTSWADAYRFLQDALTDANSAEKPVEIRAAQGVYQPDRSAAEPNGTGDRSATFRLLDGVTIQGGYAGFGQPDPNARDIELYESVLSGDLDGNDVDVDDPAELLDEVSRAENAYHVVTGIGSDESGALDGFTITGGNANDPSSVFSPQQRGGGMYNEGGVGSVKRGGGETIEYSTIISNCAFVGNSAIIGGGMYNYQSHPKISNSSFSGNSASPFCSYDVCWGGTGGGIHNAQSSPMLTNCVFRGNSAHRGGGMFNDESVPVVSLSTFVSNSADFKGGGMYNDSSSPTVGGCLFSRNTVFSDGGGMANQSSSPLVTNCVFSENSAHSRSGGMGNAGGSPKIMDCIFIANSSDNWAGGMSNSGSDAMLTNCVFAGNRARRSAGAIENKRCQPIMANCTIIQNRASEIGGGVRSGYGADALVRNSILWGNSAPEGAQIAVDGMDSEPGAITVEYSAVMGGEDEVCLIEPNDSLNWGAGNIDCDPCFADLGYWDPNCTPEDANDDYWVDGGYHLKSQAGRWDPNGQAWVIDDVTSPCIDTGDPRTPIGVEPFPNGGRINMGAYGGTGEASKSYFGEPVCETIVAGDINGDCKVNYLDFSLIARHWLEEH